MIVLSQGKRGKCDENSQRGFTSYGDQCAQALISCYFYNCTNEILAGLGEMYVSDERFAKNIDQYKEGTAAFIRDAIRVYCK